MVRLVRELAWRLEEAGGFDGDYEHTDIDNIVYEFLGLLPKKVQEEVRHG